MNLLKMLAQIEQVSAALDKLQGKGRPSWIVPTAAIAVCGLTVWQAPNLTQAFVSLDSAKRVNANTPVVVDDSPLGLQMSPSAYSLRIGTPADFGGGGSVDADMYAPTAWLSDTVHHETFTGMAASQLFSTLNEQAISPFTTVFTGDNGVTGNCSGGSITGYSNPCRALDSINVPGQLSPPWAWEARVGAGSNAGMQWTLPFASGNGNAASANLTRWYMRISIYFEENGTDHGQFDYPFHPTSHKMFNPNTIDNGFWQTWYGAPFIWGQAGGSLNGCNVGLEPNTWIEYYPSDTLPPQSGGGNGTCEHLGRGGMHKRGVMQHWFICVDYSPPSGSRIVSWGMVSADENGIAGYHNNQTTWHTTGASDFDAVVWNGTVGGGPPYPASDVSIWWDDILVLTGSSGSCQTPPSFS